VPGPARLLQPGDPLLRRDQASLPDDTLVGRRTIGSRRDLARRLNQLGCGVTVNWIQDRFGTPAFIRSLPSRLPEQTMRELIYRERHAWMQVLLDPDNAVARFSITVTDPRFRFRTRVLTTDTLDVKLGHSTFASISTQVPAKGRSLRIGAHNREYAEAYWFGNPGNYHWYALSHNEMGTGAFDHTIPGWSLRQGVLRDSDILHYAEIPPADKIPGLIAFRQRTVINTLTVLGPWVKVAGLEEPRGPDTNQVRVLAPGSWRRWKRRRKIHRILRHYRRQAQRAGNDEDQPDDLADDTASATQQPGTDSPDVTTS
jgi:hypothetical protein